MKKTWFVKYLVVAVASIILAIIVYILMPKNVLNAYGNIDIYGWPWWLPLLIPFLSLSILAVWKIIKRYTIFCYENISTGNQAYNTLFKVLLSFCGLILLPFLLIAGFPLIFVEFFKDLSEWKALHPQPPKPKQDKQKATKDTKSTNTSGDTSAPRRRRATRPRTSRA